MFFSLATRPAVLLLHCFFLSISVRQGKWVSINAKHGVPVRMSSRLTAPIDSSQQFSCISFGSPPVIQPDISRHLLSDSQNAPNIGLALAVVNEYDFVSRTDRPYVRSVIDLYRSLFRLPPVKDDDPTQTENMLPSVAGVSEPNLNRPQGAKQPWDLPKPIFWLVGEIILLREEGAQLQSGNGQGEPTASSRKILKAFVIKPEEITKLLFCRIKVHQGKEYRDRVDMISSGRFNGSNGW